VVRNSTIDHDEYRARHPIVLSDAPVSLDVFSAGGRLDVEAARRVRAFAKDYATLGNGAISIQLPQGSAQDGHARALVDPIRRELVAGGASGYVRVGHYAVTNPNLASPVRVSFTALKAQVATRCGEWPRDLASGSSFGGWENKPYWNHGCATQNALAAQVADPRDLAGPRAETPADVSMRTRAITSVRQGKDPATQWNVTGSNIGSTGSN
jgi:pilus assembly protein CpaD